MPSPLVATPTPIDIGASTVVVTGAGRGLGRFLVDALLERGAPKIYGLARDPGSVRVHPRVVPVAFDLCDDDVIARAAGSSPDATMLINNAAVARFASGLQAPLVDVRHEMAANYGGTFAAIRAFVPALTANGGGQVVNVMSLLALASNAGMTGYAASKAALHSLTQSLRPTLSGRQITVHGVYPAGIDTDMLARFAGAKARPADVAAGILDGLEEGVQDIFPDATSRSMSALYWADPKGFELAFAGGHG